MRVWNRCEDAVRPRKYAEQGVFPIPIVHSNNETECHSREIRRLACEQAQNTARKVHPASVLKWRQELDDSEKHKREHHVEEDAQASELLVRHDVKYPHFLGIGFGILNVHELTRATISSNLLGVSAPSGDS
jgi:hypothetical protein